MDPLGVAMAVVALGVYPGGLYLLALSLGFRAASGLRPGERPLAKADLIALMAAGGAVALAPLPGSPVTSLPPAAGAGPNLIAAAMLAALAVGLPALRAWTAPRTLAVAAAGAAALALPAAAASLSLGAIDSLPGPMMQAARAVVAAAVLVAAPLAADAHGDAPRILRATLTTALALLACSLVVPAGVTGVDGLLVALAVSAGVLGHALLVRAARPLLRRFHPALAAIGGSLGVAGVVLVAVAAR